MHCRIILVCTIVCLKKKKKTKAKTKTKTKTKQNKTKQTKTKKKTKTQQHTFSFSFLFFFYHKKSQKLSKIYKISNSKFEIKLKAKKMLNLISKKLRDLNIK